MHLPSHHNSPTSPAHIHPQTQDGETTAGLAVHGDARTLHVALPVGRPPQHGQVHVRRQAAKAEVAVFRPKVAIPVALDPALVVGHELVVPDLAAGAVGQRAVGPVVVVAALELPAGDFDVCLRRENAAGVGVCVLRRRIVEGAGTTTGIGWGRGWDCVLVAACSCGGGAAAGGCGLEGVGISTDAGAGAGAGASAGAWCQWCGCGS